MHHRHDYLTLSTTIAMPWPTPMHMVARPYLTSGRRPISCTRVVSMRAPDAPSGCPSAIAPPLGFILGLSYHHGPRGVSYRLKARATQAVEGGTGDHLGEARQEQRHARHVAVILSCLVGAAKVDVLDLFGRDACALHEGFEGQGAEIVGTHGAQSAAMAAYRRPHRADNPGFLDPCHDPPLDQFVLLLGHLDPCLWLAQLEALDLARHRLWKLLDELDKVGVLVALKALLAPVL
jgi:hypothetical protein